MSFFQTSKKKYKYINSMVTAIIIGWVSNAFK